MRLITTIVIVIVAVVVSVVATIIILRKRQRPCGSGSQQPQESWLSKLLGVVVPTQTTTKATPGTTQEDATQSQGMFGRIKTLLADTRTKYEGDSRHTTSALEAEARKSTPRRTKVAKVVDREEDSYNYGASPKRTSSSTSSGGRRRYTSASSSPSNSATRDVADDKSNNKKTKVKKGDKKERERKRIHESKCREILEKIFGQPFPKRRPAWLRNEKRDSRTGTGTMRALELDCYNDKLRIALEYNGKQHRVYPNTWHINRQEFEDQKKRDRLKIVRCKEEGIVLILVPDTIRYEDLYSYITERLEALGIIAIEG